MVSQPTARMRRFLLALPVLALMLAACEDPASPARAASIEILEPPTHVAVGESFRLRAEAYDAKGRPLERSASWSVDDPAVARVDAGSGVLVGLAPGAVVVTATTDGVSTQETITVTPPVDSVAVRPGDMTVGVERVLRLSATALTAEGERIHGLQTEWRSSDSAVVRVLGDGVLEGVRKGTAVVSATAGGVRGSTTVSVADPVMRVYVETASYGDSPVIRAGRSLALVAVLSEMSAGVPEVTGRRQVFWETTDETIATVSSSGLVRGVSPGPVVIRAISEGVVGQLAVEVTGAPTTLRLALSSPSILPGTVAHVTPTLRDATGRSIPDPGVLDWRWSVSDSSVVGIAGGSRGNDVGAVVRGLRPGTATIVAEVEGLRATASIEVLAPVAEVRIAPLGGPIAGGESRRLSLTLLDADGGVLGDRPARWISSDLSVASVSSAGVVTGGLPGTAIISATVEGVTGSTGVTVTGTPASPNGPWASITAGADHSCALTREGKAYCWGDGYAGQLGSPPRDTTGVPRPVATSLRFDSLSAGQSRTCALTAAGEAYCWGGLGDPAVIRRAEDFTLRSIRLGGQGAEFCGVVADHSVVCGSPNSERVGTLPGSLRVVTARQIGVTTGGRVVTPTWDGSAWGWGPLDFATADSAGTFVDASGEAATTCALRADGQAFCTLYEVRLSGGIWRFRTLAAVPGSLELTQISAGGEQVCGLTSDGRAYCWKVVREGESLRYRTRLEDPVLVSETLRFTQISAGWEHTCAITAEGAAYCWGNNSVGQLGAGPIGGRSTGPARVRDP